MINSKISILSVSCQEFSDFLKKRCHIDSQAYVVASVITVDDGDYFIDLCNEDGDGISEIAEYYFYTKPIAKKMIGMELFNLLTLMCQFPEFKSLNGRVTLKYTIHIWAASTYIAFDPIAGRARLEKMGMFQRFTKPVINILPLDGPAFR